MKKILKYILKMKNKIPEKKLTTNNCVVELISHKKQIKPTKKLSHLDEIAYMKS